MCKNGGNCTIFPPFLYISYVASERGEIMGTFYLDELEKDLGEWTERYGKGGVCDFRQNYNFYFRWLLNKVMNIFIIKDRSGLEKNKINYNYFKANCLLNGNHGITEFDSGIYNVIGSLGGEPDEFYVPVTYVVANPILGSKRFYRKDWKDHSKNGVVIFNTDIDSLGYNQVINGGLYDLISQTATLLADNIVSINCQQINSRVQVFFTADGKASAASGEAVLKRMYAGSPYQILDSDIVDKITVNPISNVGVANNITQLVELNNFIISNFFQSIGIRSNDIRKKERLITAEIEEQNDVVAISLLEILTSWQRGFDEVNELYGTDIVVELNPVLIREIKEQFMDDEPAEETTATVEEDSQDETDVETVEEETEESQPEPEEEESVEEVIEELEDVVEAVVDTIINEGGDDDATQPENSGEMVPD